MEAGAMADSTLRERKTDGERSSKPKKRKDNAVCKGERHFKRRQV